VPEPPVDPITKLGDLWILGEHRVLCGDSTKAEAVARLMAAKLASLVVTDPPYGVSYADKNAFLNAIDKGNRVQTPIENDHLDKKDSQQLWKDAFTHMNAAMHPGASVYCFMPQGGDQMMMMMMMMMIGAGIEPRHELIWLKNNHVLGRTDYAYKHEPILYAWKAGGHKFYGGFQTSVLEFDRPNASKLHPTMKPVELISRLIENSSLRGDLLYEPFCGSGTTLIAAEQLGRKCYGMELSPHYCDVIVKRWENMTGKKAFKESIQE
jgi:DNA modification methylase